MKSGLRAIVVLLCVTLSALVNSAERVVSVDGAITEIIYKLDQQHRLVAVDHDSHFPAATNQLSKVGFSGFLSADTIMEYQPDLVFLTTDSRPANLELVLRDRGVKVVVVEDELSVEGLMKKIETVAAAMDVPVEGLQLQQKLKFRIDNALAQVNADPKLSVMIARGAGRAGLMMAGKQTPANAILEIMGVQNTVSSRKYIPLTDRVSERYNPNVVVVALDPKLHHENVNSMFTGTPAFDHNRVYTMDESLLLGFGPRLPQAIAQLSEWIKAADEV